MKTKAVLISLVVAFVGLCGFLVVDSGLFKHDCARHTGGVIPLAGLTTPSADSTGEKTDADEVEANPTDKSKKNNSDFDFSRLRASQAAHKEIVMGSLYPEVKRTDDESKYKLMVELTSKGAAIKTVTLSEFDDRDPDDPQPLELIAPIAPTDPDGRLKYSLANTTFLVQGQKYPFPLDMLDWQVAEDLTREPDGSQKVVFRAVLRDAGQKDAFRITKTYRLAPGSYDLYCQIKVENLSDTRVQGKMQIQGPGGIGREDLRGDMRQVMGGFRNPEGQLLLSKKTIQAGFLERLMKKGVGLKETTVEYDRAVKAYQKAVRGTNQEAIEGARERLKEAERDLRISRNLPDRDKDSHLLWEAVTNKYFTAILRPVPEPGQEYCSWVGHANAWYYNPDQDKRGNTEDETVATDVEITLEELSPRDKPTPTQTFTFHIYLGPKDRELFAKDPYKKYGFIHTITFRGCCCPAKLITVLAFGIMTVMKAMYSAMGPLGNYGVVIMVLVFLVRLVMHPVTKKSQVSMMRMQKLGPMMEELKKKYAKDKAELNKKVMQLYKEQGVSPLSSFLPMMIQMPIWIALWSAINASVDLRGAAFLPFWITDLSSPDALFRFKEFTIPLLGWSIDSFNLLPLLMGVVMFLQQKLMPHAKASEQTNPQVAQQQKMMMIMMPLMFPIMLYKGPSGVNLYIMSSISAGVIEQMIIRRHIRQKEEEEARVLVPVTKKTGGKVKKKKPKPFFKT